MKDILKGLITALIVVYLLGEIKLLVLLSVLVPYVIIKAILATNGFKMIWEAKQYERDKKVENWRLKRVLRKQLKADAKKVKEVINKEIK